MFCRFQRLPTEQLPPLWLVYSNTPSDSGAVHSPVKQRWLTGETDIRRDMDLVASLAEQGRYATYLPCLALIPHDKLIGCTDCCSFVKQA